MQQQNFPSNFVTHSQGKFHGTPFFNDLQKEHREELRTYDKKTATTDNVGDSECMTNYLCNTKIDHI